MLYFPDECNQDWNHGSHFRMATSRLAKYIRSLASKDHSPVIFWFSAPINNRRTIWRGRKQPFHSGDTKAEIGVQLQLGNKFRSEQNAACLKVPHKVVVSKLRSNLFQNKEKKKEVISFMSHTVTDSVHHKHCGNFLPFWCKITSRSE